MPSKAPPCRAKSRGAIAAHAAESSIRLGVLCCAAVAFSSFRANAETHVMHYGNAKYNYPPNTWFMLPDGGIKDTQDARLTFTVPESQVKGLLVFVHGGSWFGEDKDEDFDRGQPTDDPTIDGDLEEILQGVRDKGYATLNINYRLAYNPITHLSEGGEFPASAFDVLSALETVLGGKCFAYVTCTDEENGLWQKAKTFADRKLMLVGGSAGAHLAVWAAEIQIQMSPHPPDSIDCVLSVAGPMVLSDPSIYSPGAWQSVINYVGGPDKASDPQVLLSLSPLTPLSSRAPWKNVKWFFVSAVNDEVVPPQTAVVPMVTALKNRGADARYFQVEGSVDANGKPIGGHNLSGAALKVFISLLPDAPYCN